MSGSLGPPRRRICTALGAACAALVLLVSGCAEIEDDEAETYQPAHLEPVGTSGLKQVTFTPLAAEQVELATERAVRDGRHTAVSYQALIYDGQGLPWVYTVSRPLTFLRVKIVVDRIDGDRVLISGGLAAGTEVVTVGAGEVYGAELDIAGGH
jgi:hypothetical protein